MDYTMKEKDGIVIIVLKNNFSKNVVKDVNKEIEKIIEQKKDKILFNLEQTNFIDSTGLALMISTVKQLQNSNGQVKFCGINQNVKQLLDVTRLNQYFDIYDNEQEAIETFK
ncbi:MAG TPA: STAS domain-containing protein [bacterium]|nr:STAS domain-containing protein [bacterium]HOL47404.1 STAS domain-containing protein [bacterium]HPQ18569.1 STAS domain-containing protein [bacterium]